MEKRNLIILITAIVIVLGVILISKYFDKFNILEQEKIEAPLVPQKSIAENFSLPLPPATTSTAVKTIKLPKPLSSRQQQEEEKKITLPPPPAQ